MGSEVQDTLPTVDLSPFLQPGSDEGRRKVAMETIASACSTYGFFRIVNHGIPVALMSEAFALSKAFFNQPSEEKIKSGAVPGANPDSSVPAGYAKHPESSGNKSEYLVQFKPGLGFNVYPLHPPEFRSILDQLFNHFCETCLLLGGILAECMGLPPDFFNDSDKDRNTDFLSPLHYFPMKDTGCGEDNNGLSAHQDGNYITMVLQDEVGGLEVLKGGEWIPAHPSEGSIIVNVGDIIQVLTNNRFISALHRVVRRDSDRYSFAFFFNCDAGKWIEPLPHFTSKIGAAPEYRGFFYKDYLEQRFKNMSIPVSKRAQDFFDIKRYAIEHE